MKINAEIREAIARDVIFYLPGDDITLAQFAEKYKIGKSTIQRDKKVYYKKWKSTGRRVLEEYIDLRIIDLQERQKSLKYFCFSENEKMAQIELIAYLAKNIVDAEKRWDTFLHPPQSKVEPDKA